MTRVFLTIVTIFAVLCSFACSKKAETSGQHGGGDTIKVGVYGDLTGQTSSFGQSTKNGIELAVEEINAAGGVERQKDPTCHRRRSGPTRTGENRRFEAHQSGQGPGGARRSGVNQ